MSAASRCPHTEAASLVEQRTPPLRAGPTHESKQKSNFDLLLSCLTQALVPMIILSVYYRDSWDSLYCETDIAQWAFIFGWIGAGVAVYQYLCAVWFWRLKWEAFKAADEDGQRKLLKQLQCLRLPLCPASIATTIWCRSPNPAPQPRHPSRPRRHRPAALPPPLLPYPHPPTDLVRPHPRLHTYAAGLSSAKCASGARTRAPRPSTR